MRHLARSPDAWDDARACLDGPGGPDGPASAAEDEDMSVRGHGRPGGSVRLSQHVPAGGFSPGMAAGLSAGMAAPGGNPAGSGEDRPGSRGDETP